MKPSYTSMLVCPLCQGKLVYVEQTQAELWCKYHSLAFPIINDLPIMLEQQARILSSEEQLSKKYKA